MDDVGGATFVVGVGEVGMETGVGVAKVVFEDNGIRLRSRGLPGGRQPRSV